MFVFEEFRARIRPCTRRQRKSTLSVLVQVVTSVPPYEEGIHKSFLTFTNEWLLKKVEE